MAEKQFHTYKHEIGSFEDGEKLQGISYNKRHAGFDTIEAVSVTSTININLKHTSTGITKTDKTGAAEVSKTGVVTTVQGGIIHNDGDIALSVSPNAVASERWDIVYLEHVWVASEGNNPASYGVQQGVAGSGIPALTSPEKRTILGYIKVDANATAFADLTYLPISRGVKKVDIDGSGGSHYIEDDIDTIVMTGTSTGSILQPKIYLPDPNIARDISRKIKVVINVQITIGDSVDIVIYNKETSGSVLYSSIQDTNSATTVQYIQGSLEFRYSPEDNAWVVVEHAINIKAGATNFKTGMVKMEGTVDDNLQFREGPVSSKALHPYLRYSFQEFNIPATDMESGAYSKTIAHGLSSAQLAKVTGVDCILYSDGGPTVGLVRPESFSVPVSISIDATNISFTGAAITGATSLDNSPVTNPRGKITIKFKNY